MNIITSKKLRIAACGIVLALTLTFTLLLTYGLMKASVKELIINNTDELAQHDMQSIQGYVSERLDAVQNVVNRVEFENPQSSEEILHILRAEVETSSFTKFALVDENGTLYTDNRGVVPAEENTFLNYFDGSNGTKFACRYDGMEHDDELVMKYLLYGIDFSDEPVEIAGIRFRGALALNYISEIQGKMKISLFDGSGYSSVIDTDGYYIVAPEAAANPNDIPNFFERIKDKKLSDGMTIDDIREKVLGRESFEFTTVDKNGNERFISIKPFADSNWCFINSIDTYVFKAHTNVFTGITLVIVLLLVVILMGSFGCFYFFKARLEKMYTTTIDGVYNRKYYNEKLMDRHITSFIMIDLDRLKQINDGYGHLAGDLAIASAAEIIHNRVGSFGQVVRYGGDEFVVAYTTKISGEEFFEQINGIMKDIRVRKLEKFPEVKLSLSIGGYWGEGITDELLPLADELLYKAKISRNCAVTNIDQTGDVSANV